MEMSGFWLMKYFQNYDSLVFSHAQGPVQLHMLHAQKIILPLA